MLIEEASADVVVEWESEIVVDSLDTLYRVITLLWVLHSRLEESLEPLQGVLVHRIDEVEVDDSEEKQLRSESNWSEH